MFKFLLFTLISLVVSFSVVANEEFHICYFSLNNEKEFEVMEDFSQKLNSYSPRKITVKEYLSSGDDPTDSFKEMLESGTQCDGLVISGHHTGSFGGKRANGSLKIDFLEKMKCDPKYQDFFENIKAVWLQGCRTLGAGIVHNDTNNEQFDADYHMFRVGDVIDEDHLQQSFSELGTEFSATLDQDNPLSSRYLKIFPRANVFGWTATAPGERAKSQYSIPYHIAHMSKLLDDRKEYFENPIREDISPEAAVRYANILTELLNNSDAEEVGPCRLLQDDTAVEGWLSHGSYSKHHLPFSFDNADLMAYAPLFNSNNALLDESRRIDCLLKNKLDREQLEGLLDIILSDERLLGYSFNSIENLLYNYKLNDPQLFELLRNRLKNSTTFSHFIQRKLASKQVSLIQKIGYFDLLRTVTGEEFSNLKDLLLGKSLEHLNIAPKSDSDYDLFDYKLTLLNRLASSNILDEEFVLKALDLNNLHLREKVLLLADESNNHIIRESSEIRERLLSAVDSYSKEKQPKMNLDNLSESQHRIIMNHIQRSSNIVAGLNKMGLLDADKFEELITNSNSIGFSVSLARNVPPTLSVTQRQDVGNRLLRGYKNLNVRKEITDSLFSSLKYAQHISKELIDEYTKLAKENDIEYRFASQLARVIQNTDDKEKQEYLIQKYIELDRASGLFSDDIIFKYITTSIDDTERQRELIDQFLKSGYRCDKDCLLFITTQNDSKLNMLETSETVVEYINNLDSYNFFEYFEDVYINTYKGKTISEAGVERLLSKIDIDERLKHGYNSDDIIVKMVGSIKSRPVDKELRDITLNNGCNYNCKLETIRQVRSSEFSSPLLYEMLTHIEVSADDGYELFKLMKELDKFDHEMPQVKMVRNRIIEKARRNEAAVRPYRDEILKLSYRTAPVQAVRSSVIYYWDKFKDLFN